MADKSNLTWRKPRPTTSKASRGQSLEEALRQSEENWRILFESTLDSLVIVDARTNRGMGCNENYARLCGFERLEDAENAVKLNAFDFIHADEGNGVLKTVVEDVFGKDVRRIREFCTLTKGGCEIWISTLATRIEYCGTPAALISVRDITERKRAEAQLRAVQENYRTVFENSAVAITVTDAKERIVSWNKFAEGLLGMDKHDLHMKPVRSLYPKGEWKKIRAQNVRRKGMQHCLETRIVKKGEEVIDVNLSLSVLKGPDGEITGSIGIITDISERKKAEEEKLRVQEQLHLIGRMAAVGQLAAGVAHELNNPLAAVQGYAQLMSAREDLDESLRSDIQTIYNEAKRACKVTANLLSFSRRRSPEKRPISMNDVIDGILELHAYHMRVSNIEVSTDLSPDLPLTMADFHQMQQVFTNLVTNAEQAMTEVSGRGSLTIRSRKAGDMIQVTFEDNGPGIPEENLKTIFDPFFTTKEVGKGTGLGLGICFEIVKDHAGRLYVESEPGKGAKFVMELPIVSEDEMAGKQAGSTEAQQAQR